MNKMNIKKIGIALFGAFAFSGAFADTIVGKWQDPTLMDDLYVPNYSAQCQVDSVLKFDGSGLLTPEFTTDITLAAGDALECRLKATNVAIAGFPVEGNWTPWQSSVEARSPSDQTNAVFVTIKN